jgi:hypothetical protein
MKVLDLTMQLDVDRPADAVWSFVAENFFANHPKWDPAIVEMRKLTAGGMGEGTEGVEVRRFGGKQEAAFVVREFRPATRFSFDNTSGPFELKRSYSFHPSNGRTRIEFRFIMAPKGVMRLLFPLLRTVIAGQVRTNIGRLAELLGRTG